MTICSFVLLVPICSYIGKFTLLALNEGARTSRDPSAALAMVEVDTLQTCLRLGLPEDLLALEHRVRLSLCRTGNLHFNSREVACDERIEGALVRSV